MLKQSFNSIQEGEFSLKDMIDFLIESWKKIAFFGMLGILSSVAYLWITPNQYQATAQIQMAKIIVNNNNNPLGINIEDPKLLLARLKLPTSYSNDEIKACGLSDQKFPAERLTSLAKFSEVKGVLSIIELKVNGPTKEVASVCAETLFKNIQASQNELIKPLILEAKTLLIKYQERLNNAQKLIERSDKSGVASSAAYLASRDEINFLTERVFQLNTLIASVDSRQAKLVSPVYVNESPVFPQKDISLIAGLISGLFLGLLLAFCEKGYAIYRSSYISK